MCSRGEFVRARAILLYDVLMTNSGISGGLNGNNGLNSGPEWTQKNSLNYTQTQLYIMRVVQSPSYSMASAVLCSMATLPYILFMGFTFLSKPLWRPKNVFKSNFATSAVIHLVRNKNLLFGTE